MEPGHVSPNLENYSAEGPQEEGGVDTNIAGPSESEGPLSIKLKINQSFDTTELKNNNDSAETLEFGNKNIIGTIIQDNESEKNHYICKFCSQVFDKHQALGGHMNGHSKDQRNLEKFEKVTTWIQATYPPPLNTTLASEAELQGTPTNGAACNSYNQLIEVGDVYGQLGRQWTTQQSAQQIQLSQVLQIQQRQQHQNYQVQEPQIYQTLQRLQSNQVLERPQCTQPLQRPQNYQAPQGLQNYHAPQGSQRYQTTEQFQNYQVPQGPQYYQASQRPQNYQAPEGPQYCQAPQRFQNYQNLQGSQSYQAPQGSQNYQASKRFQSHQTPRGPQQQLLVDANNQQTINLNSKISNRSTFLAKVPSNVQSSNSSNSQEPHLQEEFQGPQRYMPNPHNLRNGDRLTVVPFINEESNKKYYGKHGPNVLRNNQMISTPHSYDAVGQYKSANSSNASNSFNQSKDD